MLKFGVCSETDSAFASGTVPEDRTAYRLLRTAIPASTTETQRFEAIMRSLRLSGGVYRTTSARRFASLDRFFRPILEARYTAESPLWIEDWAASACITSAEWFEDLIPVFPKLRLVASDLHLFLIEVILPGNDSFVVEADGTALQYVKPPFVIPMHRQETGKLLINRWLQSRAQQKFAELKSKALLQFSDLHSGPEEWERGGVRFRRISMIHPTAVALSDANPAFQIISHSVFEPSQNTGNCDVIRAMNIFNRSYFSEEMLRQGLSACWESLKAGGLLLVGRTQGEASSDVHHASVLEKTDTGFHLIDRCTAPSEVESLAVELRP